MSFPRPMVNVYYEKCIISYPRANCGLQVEDGGRAAYHAVATVRGISLEDAVRR